MASDGYRLALYDLPLPQGFQAKAVVPARSVDEMVRVLKGADGAEADLALGEGVLALAPEGGSGVRMALRLMEGEFPDYQRVIPQEFALKVQVEGEALREAVRRVSVLSDRQNHRVDLLLEEGRILLSAEGDYGKGQEEVPAQVEGPGMAVAYNARYLLGGPRPRGGPGPPGHLRAHEPEPHLGGRGGVPGGGGAPQGLGGSMGWGSVKRFHKGGWA